MPTDAYENEAYGVRFERSRAVTDRVIELRSECGGIVRRLNRGGFLRKSSGKERAERPGGGCSLERTGRSGCGRDARCGKPQGGDLS